MPPGWRAYYPDGRTVDSSEARPGELEDGVCRIVLFLVPPYRVVVAQGDWYTWDGQRWRSTGTGRWGTWRERPEGQAVVRSCGREDPDRIEAVNTRAMEDRRWPT